MNDAQTECELCHEIRLDGQDCFYKFPDAGPNGMDMDGFCCRDCAKAYADRDFDELFRRMKAWRKSNERA